MASHEFVMEKRVVKVETARLKVHIVPMLNDFFGKHLYNQDFTEGGSEIKRGKIEQVVLYHGIKKLVVGGETKKIDPGRPARSLPDLWDLESEEFEDEGGQSLYERLIRLIVMDNPWLHKKQPYSAVFALYRPDEDDEEEEEDGSDPTVSAGQTIDEMGSADTSKEDGSTNGSTSTTDTEDDQDEMFSEDLTEIINPHE